MDWNLLSNYNQNHLLKNYLILYKTEQSLDFTIHLKNPLKLAQTPQLVTWRDCTG